MQTTQDPNEKEQDKHIIQTIAEGKILLIENRREYRKVLTNYLGLKNYVVDNAEDSGEAILYFKKFNHDLAIINIQLPGVDGIEVAEIFREENKTVRLLGYSASFDLYTTSELDIFDHYFQIPISLQEVQDVIETLLRKKDEPFVK